MQRNQDQADKEARLIIRQAFKSGQKVSYSLSRLIELNISVKVIQAVYKKGY